MVLGYAKLLAVRNHLKTHVELTGDQSIRSRSTPTTTQRIVSGRKTLHRSCTSSGLRWAHSKVTGCSRAQWIRWWAVQVLNLRPHPCEGCALPLS